MIYTYIHMRIHRFSGVILLAFYENEKAFYLVHLKLLSFVFDSLNDKSFLVVIF